MTTAPLVVRERYQPPESRFMSLDVIAGNQNDQLQWRRLPLEVLADPRFRVGLFVTTHDFEVGTQFAQL